MSISNDTCPLAWPVPSLMALFAAVYYPIATLVRCIQLTGAPQ